MNNAPKVATFKIPTVIFGAKNALTAQRRVNIPTSNASNLNNLHFLKAIVSYSVVISISPSNYIPTLLKTPLFRIRQLALTC